MGSRTKSTRFLSGHLPLKVKCLTCLCGFSADFDSRVFGAWITFKVTAEM